MACANFQCRLYLALGVRVEPDGPYPPLEARWERSRFPAAPPRPAWKEVASAKASLDPKFRPPWRPMTIEQAEAAMEEQKARKRRIAPPPPELIDRLPIPETSKEHARRVLWSGVSLGYCPKLAGPWFDVMAASRPERDIDPVFGNSYFWVVTRTNECFY
jgi:hypothetical protein